MPDQLMLLEDLTPDYEQCSGSGRIYADDVILEAAFAYFRATGFPYRCLPRHVCLQEINRLACTPADALVHTLTAYHVADTYHPHRFDGHAAAMRSPYAAFHEDKLLKRALLLQLTKGMISAAPPYTLWIVSCTQACSNFRPGFACLLYRQYCQPGAVVLDTSTGYGGRLVGFLASGMAGHYIGIDPSTQTHAGNQRMAHDLDATEKVTLYNLPAEDMPHDMVRNKCDFAFTSPPYLMKEHYCEEPTQSFQRYPAPEDWRAGFLVPMMALQYAALKDGCYALVNIEDVTLGSTRYPLVSWCIDAAQRAGFVHKETQRFPLHRRFGAGQTGEVAYESVLVFQKHVHGPRSFND